MRNLLIHILFHLLGNTTTRTHDISYLFGATTATHAQRVRKWEKALAMMWKNKDFLDFLYYQSESDKENAWKGKLDKRLVQGARIRTLFIIHSAHRASEEILRSKRSNAEEVSEATKNINKLTKTYSKVVDIDK